MNHSSFLAVFPRQLRYWMFHCSLNALPSFFIAFFYLNLRDNVYAVAGMLAAIVTFILLYATLTSLPGPFADQTHLLPRALKVGARIRGWISGITLLFLPATPLLLFTPDLWCGQLAIIMINQLAPFTGTSYSNYGPSPTNSSFLSIYSTTLLEGFILSFILLMISFFALIFLQSRERRKFFAAGRSL